MPRYRHPDALDGGLTYIRTNANKLALISSYTIGESYATVNGKILAEAAITSTDMTLGSSGNDRTLTIAGKTAPSAAAGGGGANSHVCLLDTVNSKVIEVTEEDAAQTITAGNPVNIGGFVITNKQPVAP
jgi:hypothetical protein